MIEISETQEELEQKISFLVSEIQAFNEIYFTKVVQDLEELKITIEKLNEITGENKTLADYLPKDELPALDDIQGSIKTTIQDILERYWEKNSN